MSWIGTHPTNERAGLVGDWENVQQSVRVKGGSRSRDDPAGVGSLQGTTGLEATAMIVGGQAGVPQPHPARITPFRGHPVVAGVQPGQPGLVAVTAAELAIALGVEVCFAYADPARVALREHPDGTVEHVDLNPDLADDEGWREREARLVAAIGAALGDRDVRWGFRYLAGRPDRALTHLARAIDASALVVGAGRSGSAGRLHELLEGSVGAHLSHHQHRPVVVVPTSVVDWKTPLP